MIISAIFCIICAYVLNIAIFFGANTWFPEYVSFESNQILLRASFVTMKYQLLGIAFVIAFFFVLFFVSIYFPEFDEWYEDSSFIVKAIIFVVLFFVLIVPLFYCHYQGIMVAARTIEGFTLTSNKAAILMVIANIILTKIFSTVFKGKSED